MAKKGESGESVVIEDASIVQPAVDEAPLPPGIGVSSARLPAVVEAKAHSGRLLSAPEAAAVLGSDPSAFVAWFDVGCRSFEIAPDAKMPLGQWREVHSFFLNRPVQGFRRGGAA